MSAPGETDLARLLAQMNPILRESEYVYCSVEGDVERWFPLEPVGTFREAEGLSARAPMPHGCLMVLCCA